MCESGRADILLDAEIGACCPGARSSGGDGGVLLAAVLPCLASMHVQVAVNSWQSRVLRVTVRGRRHGTADQGHTLVAFRLAR